MAKKKNGKPFSSACSLSPIKEGQREGDDPDIKGEEVASSTACCGCFHFRGGKISGRGSKCVFVQNDNVINAEFLHKETGIVNPLTILKGFSKLATQKIRECCKTVRSSKTPWAYSLRGYHLNFDDGRYLEGKEEEEQEDDDLVL